jgi:hypothetical protein
VVADASGDDEPFGGGVTGARRGRHFRVGEEKANLVGPALALR